MRTKLCVSIALLLMPMAAAADWQNSRWGMSEAEVRSTFPAAQPTTGDQRTYAADRLTAVLLTMPWRSGDFEFEARFHFDRGGRLVCVYLQLANQALALSLPGSLRQKYGAPAEHATGALFESVRWYTERDAIHLFQSRSSVVAQLGDSSLRYCARANANNSGL